MHISNEPVFKEALTDFVEFESTPAYMTGERDYKTHLLSTLAPVLTDDSFHTPGFAARLRTAVTACKADITNIAHYLRTTALLNYLGAVFDDRISSLFSALFLESKSLVSRIDAFLTEIRADYKHNPPLKSGAQFPLGLLSIFLSARSPDRYGLFRPTIVTSACKSHQCL